MMEVIDAMTNELNGLIGDINNDLLSLYRLPHFGVNNVAGNNAARTVNFELTSTTNDLTEGVTKILNDAMENGKCESIILYWLVLVWLINSAAARLQIV